MMIRRTAGAMAMAMAAAWGLSAALAQGQTWDAYDDFHTTGNNASATWQYLYSPTAGVNSGYQLFPSYMVESDGMGPTWPVWTNDDDWRFVGKDPTSTTLAPIELTVYPPNNGGTSVIGWRSPVTGAVTIDVSLSDRNSGGTGWNGISWWLFKSGDATAFRSGAIEADGGQSGMISASNVWVAEGDMIYLQVAGLYGEWSNIADRTGVTFRVTKTPDAVNFGFEYPYLGGGATAYREGKPPAGWTPVSGPTAVCGGGIVVNGCAYSNPNAPDGVQAGLLKNMGGISQEVNGFDTSKTYKVRFYAAGRTEGYGPNPIRVFVNGSMLSFSGEAYISPTVGSYTLYTSDAFTPTSSTMTLAIVSALTTQNDLASFIDGIAIFDAQTPANTLAVTNSSFESPSIGTGTYAYREGNPADNWTPVAGPMPWDGGGVVGNGSNYANWDAPQGVQAALLKGVGGMMQTIGGFEVGREYRISFYAAARNPYGPDPFLVRINGAPVTFNGSSALSPPTLYTQYISDAFTATASTMKVEFVSTLTTEQDLTSFIDDVQITKSLSRGRQLLLDRGKLPIESCMDTLNGAYTNHALWESAHFNAFLAWGWTSTLNQYLAELPQGTLWGRSYDPEYWTPLTPVPWGAETGISPYLSVNVRDYAGSLMMMKYWDEPDDLFSRSGHPYVPNRLADMAYWFRVWNQLYPNAMACTSFWGEQYTAAELTTYMQTARPDMLLFDWYRPVVIDRDNWYEAMQVFRTVANAGYDGTGRSPIPYGQFMCMYRSSYSDPLPAESLTRLQRFASLTFGYTYLGGYCYNYMNNSTEAAVMFSADGDSSANKTATFGQVAAVNSQCDKLGPALIRLKSTDVRFIPSTYRHRHYWNGIPITSWHNHDRSIPSGLSNWAVGAGGANLITSITPRGVNNDDVNNHCDWVVGFFEPLKAANVDYAYANGLHFMVCNGADAGTASASSQWIRIEFDFTGTSFTCLQRLNRTTGQPEIVNLTSIGSNRYRLDLQLEGGTADLFRFYPQ